MSEKGFVGIELGDGSGITVPIETYDDADKLKELRNRAQQQLEENGEQ